MTKKSFAAIKSAQEIMSKIQEMSEEASHKPMTAFSTLKEILSMVEKWNADFQDCDPAWQPPQKNMQNGDVRQSAVALGAFVQA